MKEESMAVFDILKQAGLLDWNTLLVGLEHGWCRKQNLIDYAEMALAQTTDEVNTDLVTIASGEHLSENNLISTGLHFLESRGQSLSAEKRLDATEKWRLAHLSWLLQKEASDEEKISELQELYAQFGFPEDMASCSVYSNNGVDPLLAASSVVDRLAQRFLGAPYRRL
jgi:hypothetical protein